MLDLTAKKLDLGLAFEVEALHVLVLDKQVLESLIFAGRHICTAATSWLRAVPALVYGLPLILRLSIAPVDLILAGRLAGNRGEGVHIVRGCTVTVVGRWASWRFDLATQSLFGFGVSTEWGRTSSGWCHARLMGLRGSLLLLGGR